MSLKESQKKYLRSLGHHLKPVVTVADGGLSDALMAEYESTLNHHELIKVKLRLGDRAQRDDLVNELCSRSGATLVQRIGNVALIYRANPEQSKIRLPSA
tara:strand:- start:3510 stop:3809 length:300 start_codon:yes stop_codon:yes gene_type:complete